MAGLRIRSLRLSPRLRWRLTLSYTAVTVGTLILLLLLVAILVLSTIFLPYDQFSPDVWVQAVDEQVVPITRLLLSDNPVNMAGIAEFVNYSAVAKLSGIDLIRLGNVTAYLRATSPLELLIFDAKGRLLGRTGRSPFKAGGEAFDPGSIPHLVNPLSAALAGERDPERLVESSPDGEQWVVAAPVFSTRPEQAELLGAVVYVVERLPTRSMIPPQTLGLVLPGLLAFLLAAGVVGAIVGSLTARSMVRRFEHLSSVSDTWSEGDFSELIDDPKGDEIALLGRRLDRMAEQLKGLLKRRQEMAVSAERNRLARDLHDSAKQQALAASFQIGAALTLYDSDPPTAKSHLREADRLVDSVRKELTDLIHELRPQAMDGRDLAEIIHQYALDWAHGTGIEVHLELQDPAGLSMEAKEGLFRILQEALANAARHSTASKVKIELSAQDDWLNLAVEDDGQGFDPLAGRSGMGLQSMRERAETIHGRFHLKSAPGDGTLVTVTVPMNTNDGVQNG